jgi:hypothetical protein
LQPVLADFVRFAYYLLLVLMKSNTFLVPDILDQQQHPSSTSINGGRTTVRQYLGNQRKTVQKHKSPGNIRALLRDTELSLRLARLSAPEKLVFREMRSFAWSELIIADPDRLTDQATIRNSGQHMQFFDLFAGVP